MFRSDARELMPGDRDVQRLRQQTVTLAELLLEHTDGWQPPQLGGKAIAQTHCHQHAIMGYDADQALLRAAGVDLDVLDAGCCGLAGNFGFEAGHYDVSRACGERVLLPAVRDAPADTLVLADGFSCRTQIEQGGTGRTPVHLAEVLAAGLRGKTRPGSRCGPPGRAASGGRRLSGGWGCGRGGCGRLVPGGVARDGPAATSWMERGGCASARTTCHGDRRGGPGRRVHRHLRADRAASRDRAEQDRRHRARGCARAPKPSSVASTVRTSPEATGGVQRSGPRLPAVRALI